MVELAATPGAQKPGGRSLLAIAELAGVTRVCQGVLEQGRRVSVFPVKRLFSLSCIRLIRIGFQQVAESGHVEQVWGAVPDPRPRTSS